MASFWSSYCSRDHIQLLQWSPYTSIQRQRNEHAPYTAASAISRRRGNPNSNPAIPYCCSRVDKQVRRQLLICIVGDLTGRRCAMMRKKVFTQRSRC